MTQLFTPFVTTQAQTPSKAREAIVPGDLVTALVYKSEGHVPVSARVTRIDLPSQNVWIVIVGFNVPQPYAVGDTLVIDLDKVIDWD